MGTFNFGGGHRWQIGMATAPQNAPPPLPSQPTDSGPSVDPRERRASPRINLESEVTFSGHDNFYTGFAEDISEGGLFLNTYDIKPMGTEVDLHFSLPDGTEVQARAVVRWVRETRDPDSDVPPGMGLQFVELGQESKVAIEAFLRQREPLFYAE